MAVTRKFLEAMGLDDSKISAIIEEHDKTVSGLKELRDKYKADADKLSDVQAELDGIKGGEDWKSKYNDLQKTFDDYKAEVQNEKTVSRVKKAFAKLLKDCGVDEKRIDAIERITDYSGMQLEENGEDLKDAQKISDGIKKEWSAFIPTNIVKGANVEQPITKESNKMTRAEIYAKDDKGHYKLSTAERQKALVENSNLLRN